MKKLVFCVLAVGAVACGPADELQQPEAQGPSQEEVVMETTPQLLKSGGVHTQAYYEWANRSSNVCGSWQYFAVSVPTNTPNITVYSQYGSYSSYGAQLYLRQGIKPTTSSYHGASLNWATNEEMISIDNPAPGTWWIGLYAHCAYTGVTVGAVY